MRGRVCSGVSGTSEYLLAELGGMRWRYGSANGGSNTRPLDCWKEVADFKEHTRRMEKAFVVRTVGRGY